MTSMDRDYVATLISEAFEKDAINQMIPKEIRREVFCRIGSVRQSEWFDAGRAGLKAQFVVKVFSEDYQNESMIEIDGMRYGIYRTYLGKNDQLELYLERKGGI